MGDQVESGTLLYVRTHGAPAGIAGAVRQAMAEIDPTVPLAEVVTLDQEVETSLWQERLVAVLSAFFGGAAVLLAGIGLYGSLAYSVEQRRREVRHPRGGGSAVPAHRRGGVRTDRDCRGAGSGGGSGGIGAAAAADRQAAVRGAAFDPLTLALAVGFVCLCAAAAARSTGAPAV